MARKRKLPVNMQVWYDRHIRLWTAFYIDEDQCQIANAGYGMSPERAIREAAVTPYYYLPQTTQSPIYI